MVRAAGFGVGGGFVLLPPVLQCEAATEFGAEIPESAWREISQAFVRHGQRRDNLEGTRDNRNPNDTRGWHKRKGDTEKRLETALNALNGINRDFLLEAANNVSLTRSGGLDSYDSLSKLDTAQDDILFLSGIMMKAEPIAREIPTDAESRKMLAYDVFKALEPFGARLSNGWVLEQRQPSHADLTGFERLAELLKIHQGDTPAATSKWLREALAQHR